MPTLLLTNDELENLAVCVRYCEESQSAGESNIVDAAELPALQRLASKLEKKCNR